MIINSSLNPTTLTKDNFAVTKINYFLRNEVHVGLGLIRDVLNNLNHTMKFLDYFTYPCLFLQGEKDAVINYKMIIKVFRKLKTDDKTFKLIESGYHELYSDVEKESVANTMVDWILERCDGLDGVGDVKSLKLKVRGKRRKKNMFSLRNTIFTLFYLYMIRK